MFRPSFIGLIINPFYIARTGLYYHIRKYSGSFTGKLLDIGCGDKPYEDLFCNISKYEGIEIESTLHAKTKADYLYDGTSLPFSENAYDVIVLNEVLEHVFNPDELLSEIYRVLKPNGKLLITVPFIWDEHEQPFDFARYTSFGLDYMIKRNDFEIEIHEKTKANFSVIFQLINTYIYKVTQKWNKLLRVIIIVLLCFPNNLLGLFFGFILPKNEDLYLDNLIIAKKRQNKN